MPESRDTISRINNLRNIIRIYYYKMPMPLRHALRATRPRSPLNLHGRIASEGLIFIERSQAFLAEDVIEGQLIGFLCPSAMYAVNRERVPCSIRAKTITFSLSSTGEALYQRLPCIPSWTLCMAYTDDVGAANIMLCDDSSIRALKAITPTAMATPIPLVCYWGPWALSFEVNAKPARLSDLDWVKGTISKHISMTGEQAPGMLETRSSSYLERVRVIHREEEEAVEATPRYIPSIGGADNALFDVSAFLEEGTLADHERRKHSMGETPPSSLVIGCQLLPLTPLPLGGHVETVEEKKKKKKKSGKGEEGEEEGEGEGGDDVEMSSTCSSPQYSTGERSTSPMLIGRIGREPTRPDLTLEDFPDDPLLFGFSREERTLLQGMDFTELWGLDPEDYAQ